MRQVARERTSVKKRDLVNVCGCELSGEWRNECVSGQISVGHSFSQTVCGNFFDEFLDEFLGDFFFTLPCTRPKSFLLGRIACKLENRS